MRHGVWLIGVFAACTNSSSSEPPTVQLPPGGGVKPTYNVPGSGHQMLFGGGSSFTFIGPLAPGNASYTDAPIFDREGHGDPDAPPGGGSMNITIDGTPYTSSSLMSATLLIEDDQPYIALDGYTIYTGTDNVDYASEVVVIVPQSDFALNTPIALDGQSRVALFAHGRADSDAPDLVGAAVTGTVTFTGGDLTTMVSGTISGDFGRIDYIPDDQQPTGNITAGSYSLAVQGPAEVYCDGTLAGHEGDFAGITTAQLGIGDAAVSVATPDAYTVTVTGAPGFDGAFELDAQDDGLFAGFTTETGSGPDGTDFLGKYLVLDGASATAQFVNGGIGAGYATADRSGTCTVAFGATLTGP